MTEHNPDHEPEPNPEYANDDTWRIPSQSTSGTPAEPPYEPRYESPSGPTAATPSTHRYQGSGGADSPYAGPQSPYSHNSGASHSDDIGGFGFDRRERERRSNRLCGAVIAGILAAALVVGGRAPRRSGRPCPCHQPRSDPHGGGDRQRSTPCNLAR